MAVAPLADCPVGPLREPPAPVAGACSACLIRLRSGHRELLGIYPEPAQGR